MRDNCLEQNKMDLYKYRTLILVIKVRMEKTHLLNTVLIQIHCSNQKLIRPSKIIQRHPINFRKRGISVLQTGLTVWLISLRLNQFSKVLNQMVRMSQLCLLFMIYPTETVQLDLQMEKSIVKTIAVQRDWILIKHNMLTKSLRFLKGIQVSQLLLSLNQTLFLTQLPT